MVGDADQCLWLPANSECCGHPRGQEPAITRRQIETPFRESCYLKNSIGYFDGLLADQGGNLFVRAKVDN